MSGWLKAWRKIRDSKIWKRPEPFDKRSAWLDLLLRASHKRTKLPVGFRWRELEAGQLLTSQQALAQDWRWSRSSVRRFLEMLKGDDMITTETDRTVNKGATLITISNWEDYQGSGNMTDPVSDPDPTYFRPARWRGQTEEDTGDTLDRDPRNDPRQARDRPTREHIQEEQEESLSSVMDPKDQGVDFFEEATKRGGLNVPAEELQELRAQLEGLLEVYNVTTRDARTVTPRLLSSYAYVLEHWGGDAFRALDAVHGLLCEPERWALNRGLALDHVFRDVETAERYAFFGRDRWETSQAKATYERELKRRELGKVEHGRNG